MTKVFEKNGKRIVVADDATIDQFGGGWTEEAHEVNEIVLAVEVREKRDALLLASDAEWAKCTSMMWELGSYAEWKKSEHCKGWATYRKALRDIPGQADFPQTVNWPEQPGGTE